MEITIDSVQEILGSCDVFQGQPGTDDTALRNPALDKPDSQRSIDIALKAPTAVVEDQGECVPYFLLVETQYSCCCCGCPKGNADPCGIKAGVCRLRQIEPCGDLCSYRNCGDKALNSA